VKARDLQYNLPPLSLTLRVVSFIDVIVARAPSVLGIRNVNRAQFGLESL
jgi:hypothetical protein